MDIIENILGDFIFEIIYFGIFLFVYFWSFRSLREYRLMQDMPTIPASGAYIGLVELKGNAESETLFTSPLVGNECVWFEYSVEEEQKGNKNNYWVKVMSSRTNSPFYLRDESGVIRILPDGATMEFAANFEKVYKKSDPFYYKAGPSNDILGSTGKRRFIERWILPHQPIYVIGSTRLRDDVVAPEVAVNSDAPLYHISTKSEEELQVSRKWTMRSCMVLAGIMVVLACSFYCCAYSNSQRGIINLGLMFDETFNWQQFAQLSCIFFGIYSLIWSLGWFWSVYNSLIGLKNRVDQAGSNIDVQLKRRSDLIPSLVRVVEGMKTHEQETQLLVAKLRSQNMTRLDGASESMRACVPLIRGMIEKYPTLTANDLFLNLQQQLIETEQKIALARSFYNEMIEYYNNRREMFPDKLIASLAGLKTKTPIFADDFEKAVVHVTFAK
ncbi:MAG: LemA family protein [Thermoguttaceae bacterium]